MKTVVILLELLSPPGKQTLRPSPAAHPAGHRAATPTTLRSKKTPADGTRPTGPRRLTGGLGVRARSALSPVADFLFPHFLPPRLFLSFSPNPAHFPFQDLGWPQAPGPGRVTWVQGHVLLRVTCRPASRVTGRAVLEAAAPAVSRSAGARRARSRETRGVT
ncbi:hypothetical protein H8959_013730 [Pygathrix nigripes]